jgi:hypothetical protein
VLRVVLEGEGTVEEVVLDTTASGRFRDDALTNWKEEGIRGLERGDREGRRRNESENNEGVREMREGGKK